jgi:hypothetical protein
MSLCPFYLPEIKKCQNAYCYYEISTEKTCPVKIDYMIEIGAVDQGLRKRLQEEEKKTAEAERAKAVIWGKNPPK